MKICVITFCNNGNYGSELQAMAMNYFCQAKGHDVDFVKVKSPYLVIRGLKAIKNKITMKILSFTNKELKYLYQGMNDNLKTQYSISIEERRYIAKCVNEHIKILTVPLWKFKKQEYDCYICGSDQIWSPLLVPFHPEFFLHGISADKKIAYAPSLGLNRIPQFFFRTCKEDIADFTYLSVREECAQQILEERTGIKAVHVLDPTMLVGRKCWNALIEEGNICVGMKGNYCLCYFLGNISEEQMQYINKIAAGRRVIVLPYAENAVKIQKGMHIMVNPLEFVCMVKEADIIFTDSFHGTVFSILYHKQFITFGRNHEKRLEQTSRIFSLLKMFELEEKYCENVNDFDFNREIDYNHVEEILVENQKISYQFLADALENIENGNSKKK